MVFVKVVVKFIGKVGGPSNIVTQKLSSGKCQQPLSPTYLLIKPCTPLWLTVCAISAAYTNGIELPWCFPVIIMYSFKILTVACCWLSAKQESAQSGSHDLCIVKTQLKRIKIEDSVGIWIASEERQFTSKGRSFKQSSKWKPQWYPIPFWNPVVVMPFSLKKSIRSLFQTHSLACLWQVSLGACRGEDLRIITKI